MNPVYINQDARLKGQNFASTMSAITSWAPTSSRP
jgi:hypothetical protein